MEGLPGGNSAKELSEEYLRRNNGDVGKACDSLIRWQAGKCAVSGFATGIGGLATLPVSMSVNVASVLYVQVRMIAAIAHLGGADLKTDQVRSLVYLCLTGNAAAEITKDVGTRIVIRKFVEISGKLIPLAGGLIGAGVDAASTKMIGGVAKKVFVEQRL